MTAPTPVLAWIDIEEVVRLGVHRFRGAALRAQAEAAQNDRVEPTMVIARAALTGQLIESSAELDVAVSLTKTIQNAVGLLHQDILGAVSGWESTGSSGGAVDLKGVSPVLSAPTNTVYAELKMRYNTIKASDEKDTWDQLKQAVAFAGSGSVGYIFQIVPKTNQAYDRPWRVSGRVEHPSVRCADGVTAYHLVTGHANALQELLHAMPYIMTRIVDELLGTGSAVEANFFNRDLLVQELIDKSLPLTSAHA